MTAPLRWACGSQDGRACEIGRIAKGLDRTSAAEYEMLAPLRGPFGLVYAGTEEEP